MAKVMQIYHNPRCSKSRETLALLKKHHVEPEIILYLEQPPSLTQLCQLLKKLKLKAHDLLRTQETEYQTLGLGDAQCTDEQLLKAMIQYPKLMERPIVVCGEQAVLGRPPENILKLL